MRMCQKLWGILLIFLYNVPSSLIQCKAMDLREVKPVVPEPCEINCSGNSLMTRRSIPNNCTHFLECRKFGESHYTFLLRDCENPFVFDKEIYECVMPPVIERKKFNRNTCTFAEDLVSSRTKRRAEKVTMLRGGQVIQRSHSRFSAFKVLPNENQPSSSEAFSAFSDSGSMHIERIEDDRKDFMSKPNRPINSEENSFGTKWERSWSEILIKPPSGNIIRKQWVVTSAPSYFGPKPRKNQDDTGEIADSLNESTEDGTIRGQEELISSPVNLPQETEEKSEINSSTESLDDSVTERSQQPPINKPYDDEDSSPSSLRITSLKNATREIEIPARPEQLPVSKSYDNKSRSPVISLIKNTTRTDESPERFQESPNIQPEGIVASARPEVTPTNDEDTQPNESLQKRLLKSQTPITNHYDNGSSRNLKVTAAKMVLAEKPRDLETANSHENDYPHSLNFAHQRQDAMRENKSPENSQETPVTQLQHRSKGLSPNNKVPPTDEATMRKSVTPVNEPRKARIIQPYGAISSRSINSFPKKAMETSSSEDSTKKSNPTPILKQIPKFPAFPKFDDITSIFD